MLRHFYGFHLDAGRGPIVNPFPLDRSRRSGRAHAHHNPLDPFGPERTGRYRPRLPKRIPDEQFDQIFAGLKSNRDRALLAFWVSTGARAEELLDSLQGDVQPGDQLISVTRKGSRAVQELPASPDAFVWLRLYQEETWRKGAPRGRRQPLWFTLRRPFRPLADPAARAMFTRAQDLLGSNWSIHDLRHTGAWRMSQDPEMSLIDVQWVLGHAHVTTTQLYTNSQELHQTGEETAGQQLIRLPGRRSGRPDASILTWEDLAAIPSDARFAHQGACTRREGQKRSDEGTRGFVARVRVPGRGIRRVPIPYSAREDHPEYAVSAIK